MAPPTQAGFGHRPRPLTRPRPLAVPRPPSEAEDAQRLATPTSLATPTGGSSAASRLPSGDSHAHLPSATPTGPVFLGPRPAASPPSCLGSGHRACALLPSLPPAAQWVPCPCLGPSRLLESRLCSAGTEGSGKVLFLWPRRRKDIVVTTSQLQVLQGLAREKDLDQTLAQQEVWEQVGN